MSSVNELEELRNAIRSLQGGLLAALDSLEAVIEKSENRDALDEQISRLKCTVQSLQGLQQAQKQTDEVGAARQDTPVPPKPEL